MKTQFHIGNLEFSKPIVQGGMGIGVSLSSLAGHVSKLGGLGVLSAVEMGSNYPDYIKNPKLANRQAMMDHFKRSKEISGNRPIGINIMVALTQYEQLVKDAVKTGYDIIFAGAGLPLSLPELTRNSLTKIAPIISSKRVAKLILKHWWRHYEVVPDAIVLEGPLAGGHLGFKNEDLTPQRLAEQALPALIPGVLEEIKPYEDLVGRHIPLIAGGGITTAADVRETLAAGADAVQIGSRFVATNECDASQAFKEAMVNATASDIEVIVSPAGLPGRAIHNRFLEEVKAGLRHPKTCPINCIKSCDYKTAPYCIGMALIAGRKGDLDNGYVFSGANAYKISEISTVEALMNELTSELD
ncbi:nitronate monooxygenase family protein [Acetobacterium wieringae]|uniref:NAD(P)H-dependent flavin oxidoreductase n=1 Tax=Acetobacterium wieringae TaxID=52694 RepID=UPI0026EE48B6|nr:nitronate monooxygenase family protein [Acetobacterium wieringae]